MKTDGQQKLLTIEQELKLTDLQRQLLNQDMAVVCLYGSFPRTASIF